MPEQRDERFADRLFLRRRPPHASWVFRYTAGTGKRREMGLGRAVILADGSVDERDAKRAIAEARRAASMLSKGADPILCRDKAKAETKAHALKEERAQEMADRERRHWTLARCARDYHARVIEPSRTDKHAAQWIASLENHIPAGLWDRPISSVTERDLVAAVVAIRPDADARVKSQWMLETKRRVAGRLKAVFDEAVMLNRADVNVAERLVDHVTRRAPRALVTHWRSIPYRDAPALAKALLHSAGSAADALLFTMLTAARTAETMGAEWAEIDFDARVWSVPASRMKGRRPHSVHLSSAAIAVLKRAQGADNTVIFPSPSSSSGCMSNMAMLNALDRIGMRDRTTVHGLRATFSTWANETKAARPEVVEAALAHVIHGQERPYNRAEYLAERARLLDAWALFLLGSSNT